VPKPLLDAVRDLSHASLSLGNHMLRMPLRDPQEWADQLAYARREAERLAKEFGALESDALDFARRIG
jgi:hypothetical protein